MKTECKNRWYDKSGVREIYVCADPIGNKEPPTIEGSMSCPEILLEEVKAAVTELEMGKRQGKDRMAIELLNALITEINKIIMKHALEKYIFIVT